MDQPFQPDNYAERNRLRRARPPLDTIFAPKTVAVIGASEAPQSVGRTVLWNLISNPFGGTVFPVNPSQESVLGIKTYPNISAVPQTVDLAIIVTPAPSAPAEVEACAAAGVKAVIIIPAGFRETGPQGAELERQILDHARRARMWVIGPNCLGIMNPFTGLNATYARGMAQPGNVGFISQSGALCTAILDWSLHNQIGFSVFISAGGMIDVGWGDLVDYLGNDPRTKSILIYMESIDDARSFLSAAREVALRKPIIVIKAGRTAAAARAAASHTGSLTGRDEVLDAAFRRCGILRVSRIADLFYMAEILAKQPRPKGPRLTILTNAGGPGVLATDELIIGGGQLAELSAETATALGQLLAEHRPEGGGAALPGNPIDILDDAGPRRYRRAVELAARDPGSDGLLVILTPQNMTDPTQTAEQLKQAAREIRKPILASWMGGADVAAGIDILNRANIPTLPYPETAVRMFNYMWQYNYNLRGLYETPTLAAAPADTASGPSRAAELIAAARQAGRVVLPEFEAKQLLAAYGLPVVETQLATSPAEAVELAAQIGYPVVLKLHSHTVTHKTDVGGVRLNLADAAAVRRAYEAIEAAVAGRGGPEGFQGVTVQRMIGADGYEIIAGSSVDARFGPVLLFGLGGKLAEVFKDRALALPPLNTTLARRMMEQTRIFAALRGEGGRRPVDLAALEQFMVRFGQLVIEQPWIKEIDVNPVLVLPEGEAGAGETPLLVLDALVILHDPGLEADQLPRPAIRPYPTQYVIPWELKDGAPVTIRPIRPEDEPLLVKFHETLSESSVYYRYFHDIKLSQRVSHERLSRICFIDYDREMALVVDRLNPDTGEHEILGVGRLVKLRGFKEAEFAIIISDRWQAHGLGTQLLRLLLQVGRDEHVERVVAEILPDNTGMQNVCKKLGFRLNWSTEEQVVKAEIDL